MSTLPEEPLGVIQGVPETSKENKENGFCEGFNVPGGSLVVIQGIPETSKESKDDGFC